MLLARRALIGRPGLACRAARRQQARVLATSSSGAGSGGGGGGSGGGTAAAATTAADLAAVKSEIAAAISVGAPLYNCGRPGDCYQVYRGAAQRLAASPATGQAASQVLRSSLLEAAAAPDPSAAAWALRRAFDAVLGMAPPADYEPLPEGAVDFPVLDCSAGLPADVPRWQVLDDVVMGGASSSTIGYDDQQRALVFSGNVTTAFNGGFASVRSLPWAGWAALGRGGGVRMLVRGDGRTYKLNLKTDDSWDGVAWQADFTAGSSGSGADGWQVVDLPFSAFYPSLRGRVVSGQPPLDGGRVRQLGFMLSKFGSAGGVLPDFREGGFSLAVRGVSGLAAPR